MFRYSLDHKYDWNISDRAMKLLFSILFAEFGFAGRTCDGCKSPQRAQLCAGWWRLDDLIQTSGDPGANGTHGEKSQIVVGENSYFSHISGPVDAKWSSDSFSHIPLKPRKVSVHLICWNSAMLWNFFPQQFFQEFRIRYMVGWKSKHWRG